MSYLTNLEKHEFTKVKTEYYL